MRLDEESESSNVEDRRGIGLGGIGGVGIGTVVIALAASYFFGIDPSVILGLSESIAPPPQQQRSPGPQPVAHDEGITFVRKAVSNTEKTWEKLFQQMNSNYEKPRVVVFTGAVQSSCGIGRTATGPFYCPGDQTVYIDLKFYEDLRMRFRAPGDFAQAYVIAHEIGHHVQNLLGISRRVDESRRRLSPAESNKVSVRMELQADCYAGIWAHHTDQRIIEPGDIEEALGAATAIGDDRLQKQMQGHVVPESFTHGTSEQRVRWFKTGLDTGSLKACDTFAARQL